MFSVAVIDYGMGNLHSISKALQHVSKDTEVWVTSDPQKIFEADRVVFPGVGAIRDCMQSLRRLDLVDVITKVANEKPFLGICLGLQALLNDSEESPDSNCLGLFPGSVLRFKEPLLNTRNEVLKVPHMGWNNVSQVTDHPLWNKIPQNSRFYFVHSYYASVTDASKIAASANYPIPFTCALAANKLFAVQFHPEKSQSAGLQLLANFLAWDGVCER